MKPPRRACSLAVALGLAGCASVPATLPPPRPAGPAPAVAIERVERDVAVPAGRLAIRIDNRYGDIHVRNSNTRAVGVRAVVQRIGAEPPDPDVRLARAGATVAVAVGVPGVPDVCRDLLPGGWRRARVDLTVFVPPEVAVDARAACDGRVTAKNVRGDLAVRTVAGAIDASAVGRLEVRSVRGAIRARQSSGKWLGTSRVASRHGPVVVVVPVFTHVALEARGCGALRGSLSVERRERARGCWSARATFGDGTTPLEIESGGGFVELRALGAPVD